jgi:hypothetical protein
VSKVFVEAVIGLPAVRVLLIIKTLSTIIGPAAWKDAEDDDDLAFIVEAETHAPFTDSQTPLNGTEFANVSGVWIANESVESLEDATLDGLVEPL